MYTDGDNLMQISANGGDAEILVESATDDFYAPQILPDGKTLMFTAGPPPYRIMLQSLESGESKELITHGGIEPIWSPDGRELFYRNNNEVLMVAVKTDPVLRLEKPKALFQSEFVTFSSYRDTFWDIHPNGNRFLIIKPFKTEAESASGIPRQINIVLNWFEELKERVPVP